MTAQDGPQYCFHKECDDALQVRAKNAEIHSFRSLPGFRYVVIVCPKCSGRNGMIPMTNLLTAEKLGCTTVVGDAYPPLDMVAFYEEMTGQLFVASDFPLSTHDENEVAFMRYLLDHHASELLTPLPSAA